MHTDSRFGNSLSLTETKRLLKAITDLANIHPSASGARRFLKKHPDLIDMSVLAKRHNPNVSIELSSGEPLSQEENLTLVLWEDVQRIWRGDSASDRILTALLFVDDPIEAHITYQPGGIGEVFGAGFPWDRILARWKHGRIDYTPKTQFQKALYELLLHSHQARVCDNPDCPTPFFVSQRNKLCGSDCAEIFQRKWKRQWWNKNRKGKKARKTPKQVRIEVENTDESLPTSS